MQGIVTDEKGAYVKAAIVRLIIAKDSDDESGAVAVTYAETDEEGKFVIQDLNPDEKYIIEVLVESADSGVDAKAAEAGLESEAAEVEQESEPQEVKAEPEPEAAEVEQESEPADDMAVQVSYLDDPDPDDEEEASAFSENAEAAELSYIIDSLMINNMIEETVRENIPVDHLYSSMGFHLKDKPYLTRNNLW